MSEHERIHERAEREAEDLERKGDALEHEIDSARQDWESKKHDTKVPGAQPEGEDEDREGPPPEADITPGD